MHGQRGCLHCSRYACRHVRDFGWRLQKEIRTLIKTEDYKYCNACPGSNIPYIYIPGLYDGMNPRLTLVYCSYHEKDGKVLQAKLDGSVDYDKVYMPKKK